MPIFAIAVFFLVLPAAAEPLPPPKVGQCPSGYASEASYCTPRRDGPSAVPKHGQCPSGWTQSGAYCVEMRRRRPLAQAREHERESPA
jgi:hypothetical protein